MVWSSAVKGTTDSSKHLQKGNIFNRKYFHFPEKEYIYVKRLIVEYNHFQSCYIILLINEFLLFSIFFE